MYSDRFCIFIYFVTCPLTIRSFKCGMYSFIAPKAYLLEGGFDGREGYRHGYETLAVAECMYVAVLSEVGVYYLCYLPATKQDEPFVDVFGLQVRGKIGLVPQQLLSFSSPFLLSYSTTTCQLQFSFSFFSFNRVGMYMSVLANFNYAMELTRKKNKK